MRGGRICCSGRIPRTLADRRDPVGVIVRFSDNVTIQHAMQAWTVPRSFTSSNSSMYIPTRWATPARLPDHGRVPWTGSWCARFRIAGTDLRTVEKPARVRRRWVSASGEPSLPATAGGVARFDSWSTSFPVRTGEDRGGDCSGTVAAARRASIRRPEAAVMPVVGEQPTGLSGVSSCLATTTVRVRYGCPYMGGRSPA